MTTLSVYWGSRPLHCSRPFHLVFESFAGASYTVGRYPFNLWVVSLDCISKGTCVLPCPTAGSQVPSHPWQNCPTLDSLRLGRLSFSTLGTTEAAAHHLRKAQAQRPLSTPSYLDTPPNPTYTNHTIFIHHYFAVFSSSPRHRPWVGYRIASHRTSI